VLASDGQGLGNALIDIRKLKELVKLMVENDLSELDLRDEAETVVVRRSTNVVAAPQVQLGAAPVPVPAPAPAADAPAAATPAEEDDSLHAIVCPMVGTFYSAPTAARSPSASSAPATNSASRPSASTPRPTRTRRTSSSPTARSASGPGPPRSYLNIPRIISAAEVADVDAIHPGLRLPRRARRLRRVCRDCKIEFIGPSPEAMRKLGDKVEAKRYAASRQGPRLPRLRGRIDDEDEAARSPAEIGYPVIIKAAAGGGGRGMRVCHNEATLRTNLKQAQQEAQAAFGDGAVFIEKFLEHARHVEVQVLGDKHGHAVHLYERDCSMQRRHQKLIEEAPGPNIDRRSATPSARPRRGSSSAGYAGAATVEFLMDDKQNFYMLEVNTRVQVEHPVTELITGVDIVQTVHPRRRAASPCPSSRRTSRSTGTPSSAASTPRTPPSATSCPAPGRSTWHLPGGPGVRLDTHVVPGLPRPAQLRLDDRQAHRATRRVRNLIVEVPGTQDPETIIVVGAHYDTVPETPGADDNASGVAAVLALAHWFRANPQPVTIRFVLFANEEPPYFHGAQMGSFVRASAAHASGDRIVAMLAFDMLGYFTDKPVNNQTAMLGSQLGVDLPEREQFIVVAAWTPSAPLVLRVASAWSGEVPIVGVAAPETVRQVALSDHWSYWQMGYPAVMITDTAFLRNPHYHRPTDTADTLDYRSMTSVVRSLRSVITDLAADPPAAKQARQTIVGLTNMSAESITVTLTSTGTTPEEVALPVDAEVEVSIDQHGTIAIGAVEIRVGLTVDVSNNGEALITVAYPVEDGRTGRMMLGRGGRGTFERSDPITVGSVTIRILDEPTETEGR
jgi:acetyl-CoA carboxylase biotin carboxylase subunit